MINWFPGHMNKTLKQMQSDSKLCDCFVYVLDARCPKSCINPEFVKVVGKKPIIFILNKADLVQKSDIEKHIQYFKNLGHECVSLNATVSGNSKSIINAIKNLFSERIKQNKDKGVNFIIRAMILGVPNSGKSTIINNLCKTTRAVTGNKAGVTKNKLWVKTDSNIEFMDTPGVLLPNFEDENVAYNLAFVGSVKDEVVNLVDVAEHLIGRLLQIDNNIIQSKYGVDFSFSTQNHEILESIAKKRGCMMKGGLVDLERTAKILLTDFRSGKLGKICLEN